MKKFLLFLAILFCLPAFNAAALEVQFLQASFKQSGTTTRWYWSTAVTNQQVTITPDFTTGATRFSGDRNKLTISKGNGIKISAGTGYTITKIVFGTKCALNSNNIGTDTGAWDMNTATWTGNAPSVTFTNNDLFYIYNTEGVTVTYEEGGQVVATPEITKIGTDKYGYSSFLTKDDEGNFSWTQQGESVNQGLWLNITNPGATVTFKSNNPDNLKFQWNEMYATPSDEITLTKDINYTGNIDANTGYLYVSCNLPEPGSASFTITTGEVSKTVTFVRTEPKLEVLNTTTSPVSAFETWTIPSFKQGASGEIAYVRVKGEALEKEVTITAEPAGVFTIVDPSSPSSEITTIPKETANSTSGKEIKVTFTPTEAGTTPKITFTSGELTWTIHTNVGEYIAQKDVEYDNLAGLSNHVFDATSTDKVHYTGEAVVTYVSSNAVFMQDATAGIFFLTGNIDNFVKPAIGDKVSFADMTITKTTGIYKAFYLNGTADQFHAVAGTPVEPKEVAMADLESYPYQLIKVIDTQFAENGKFEQSRTLYPIKSALKDNTGTSSVGAWAELNNQEIPTYICNITGIYIPSSEKNYLSPAIYPRSMAEIEAVDVVMPEITFESTTTALNKTEKAQYVNFDVTINTADLKGEVTLTATEGLTLSQATIPADAPETTITCSYIPNALPAVGSVLKLTATTPNGEYVDVVKEMKFAVLGAPTFTFMYKGVDYTAPDKNIPVGGILPVERVVTISGSNITGPVTIELPEGFTASTTELLPDAANSVNAEVTFTVSSGANGDLKAVKFGTAASAVTTDLNFSLSGITVPVDVTDLSVLRKDDTLKEAGSYILIADAAVTYIDGSTVYIQRTDADGKISGAQLILTDQVSVKAGDALTNLQAYYSDFSLGWLVMKATNAGQTEVEPIELRAFELGDAYTDCLVRVKDAKVVNVSEGLVTVYSCQAPTANFGLMPFDSALSVPTECMDVTGIASATTLRPRSEADFKVTENQTPEVAQVSDYDSTDAVKEVIESTAEGTAVATFKLAAENLNGGTIALPTKAADMTKYQLVLTSAEGVVKTFDMAGTTIALPEDIDNGEYTAELKVVEPGAGMYPEYEVTFFSGNDALTRTFTLPAMKIASAEGAKVKQTAEGASTDPKYDNWFGGENENRIVFDTKQSDELTLKVSLAGCYEPVVMTIRNEGAVDTKTDPKGMAALAEESGAEHYNGLTVESATGAEVTETSRPYGDGQDGLKTYTITMNPAPAGQNEYDIVLKSDVTESSSAYKSTISYTGGAANTTYPEYEVQTFDGGTLTGVELLDSENGDGRIRVYTLQGVRVLDTDNAADVLSLTPGLYIINGKKMMIRR